MFHTLYTVVTKDRTHVKTVTHALITLTKQVQTAQQGVTTALAKH